MPSSDPSLDPEALKAATAALIERLGAEAKDQNAYLQRFADGRISLELEWIDPRLIARAVVLAYLAALSREGRQR